MTTPTAVSERLEPLRQRAPWLSAALTTVANAMFFLFARWAQGWKLPNFVVVILGIPCVLWSIYFLFAAGTRSKERIFLSLALRGASLLLVLECIAVSLRALKLL